jgi:hypothetical protein
MPYVSVLYAEAPVFPLLQCYNHWTRGQGLLSLHTENLKSQIRQHHSIPIPNIKSSIVNSNSASRELVRLWRIYPQADKVGGGRDTGQSHKPCLENWPSRVHPAGQKILLTLSKKICANLRLKNKIQTVSIRV